MGKENIRPLKVKLLSFPTNPLGTLFYVWEQSRTNDPVPMPQSIEEIMASKMDVCSPDDYTFDAAYMLKAPMTAEKGAGGLPWLDLKTCRERIWDVVDQILDEDIPCTENLNFVFAIENMSISLREQMVRHRIGVTVGERTGIDIVPEISKSSWWSQTTRMLPMGKFYTDGRYIRPEGLDKTLLLPKDTLDPTATAGDLYDQLMKQIEYVYNALIEAGVAMEDARQVIPVAATHGITWSLNLKAMMHIVGKRACWVAQANLWENLISGMVDELCTKVSPIFRKIISPPCFKKGKYNACPYFQINKERVQGRDHMPPCPLYVYHETQNAVDAVINSIQDTGDMSTWYPDTNLEDMESSGNRDVRLWLSRSPVERRMLEENIERFERLWKLNVMTGEPLGS